MRLYRRDEKGKVVKDFDHCVDSLRYLVMEMHEILQTKPVKRKPSEEDQYGYGGRISTGWMG